MNPIWVLQESSEENGGTMESTSPGCDVQGDGAPAVKPVLYSLGQGRWAKFCPHPLGSLH